MREILFRAAAINRDKGSFKTKYKNGDWVYGLITRLYDERFENLPAEMTNTDGISGIDVDYRTIGQYTGLTDRKGKKIFEGDIVICFDRNAEETFTAIVEFGNPNGQYNWGFQLKPVGKTDLNTDILLWVEMEESGIFIEVIGNIHDNPELLKGDNND